MVHDLWIIVHDSWSIMYDSSFRVSNLAWTGSPCDATGWYSGKPEPDYPRSLSAHPRGLQRLHSTPKNKTSEKREVGKGSFQLKVKLGKRKWKSATGKMFLWSLRAFWTDQNPQKTFILIDLKGIGPRTESW